MSSDIRFEKTFEFPLLARKLRWPWVAFAPDRSAFAVPEGPTAVAVRREGALDAAARVDLPKGFVLPLDALATSGSTARQPGLHAIAVHPDGRSIAALAWDGDKPVACVVDAQAAGAPIDLGPAVGAGAGPQAAAFSADGRSIWATFEDDARVTIARLDAADLRVVGRVDFPCPPLPAAHELHLHPREDAVLLLMACGQDGTFARVARATDGGVELVPNGVESGMQPAGLADFDRAGDRVCVAGDDGVALLRWPDLAVDARAAMPKGLVNRYSGIRFGDRFLIAATDEEEEEIERVVVVDAATLRAIDEVPSPAGMWAGRLGEHRLVTIVRGAAERWRAVVHDVTG